MAYRDLPQFLKALEEKNLIDNIDIEVDPVLEITEITDRVSKKYGKALRFNNVKGSNYPLVINTMGTYERLNIGLGVESLDAVADEIEDYMDLSAYVTLMGKIKAIPKLAPLPFIFPKKVSKAPCQEVVEEPNLDSLPIIKCWPQDGGRYITLPLVFTKDPDNGQQNVGMYRLQVYDKRTTGMHWHLHKDGKEIYEKYRKLGKKMPVSVALGCDPATIYSSTAPLPKMIDEMIFAGYLRKKSVELVKCITNDIYVPANAEFILEGYVDLNELREEGPFGDHTGYYSLSDMYPVFHIEKITRKKNPVYPTTIVGKPPMEDCYLGKATERIFLPLMKIQCPEIVDIDFPLEGVFHNCAIVSIKKAFPRHSNKVLYSLWGLGQMMYTKNIIVVDEKINVHDYKEVLKEIIKNVTYKNHLVITEGPLDALDHASDRPHQGFRLGVDATTKLDKEEEGKSLDLSSFENLINGEKSPVKIINYDKSKNTKKVVSYLEEISEEDSRFVVVVDEWINTEDFSTVAWKIFNNIDPKRDTVINMKEDNSIFIGIDATRKKDDPDFNRHWPDDIEMTEEIKNLVDERWPDYGISFD